MESTRVPIPPSPGAAAAPPLNRPEKVFLGALFGGIGALTLVCLGLLTVVSSIYHGPGAGPGASTTGAISFFGAGILAYTFGLRHGVDADHIAAIDNTTRKLLQEGGRPLTVGTWFSLGHSTIVFVLSLGIVGAASWLNQHIAAFQQVGSIVGSLISGGFLYLIALINLVIVFEVHRIFRGLRTGRLNEKDLEDQLQNRGFLNRYFGRLFRVVRRPRQVYPIGVLFGLGFDTASEIFLLGFVAFLSVGGAPVYVVLLLPLLFTCGMVLIDSADGVTMRFAYGWAFHRPVRKVFYNLTVTVISVVVAFVIGTVELLQVLVQELGLSGSFWTVVRALDFETLGYVVVGTFVVTWAVATAYYRYKHLDEVVIGSGPSASGPAF